MEALITEIDKCIQCRSCELCCPIYVQTREEVDTPHYRLQIAKKVFMEQKITQKEYISIFNCPKCEKCQISCTAGLKIAKIIGKAREELFRQGYGLLPGHQELRAGILERKNSVKGDPVHLLDYLPAGIQMDEKTTTLYFAGCMSGYFMKDIARSSVTILEKIGDPFKVINNEICCGSPLMDLGDVESAKVFFQENLNIFNRHRVKDLIVSCSGCFRAFSEFYPEVLGRSVRVHHITDVIADALKVGKLELKKMDKRIMYHDPCHLSREFGKYLAPREILKASTVELVEFACAKQAADCCGADSAVRAAFKDLAMQVALRRIDAAEGRADILTTSCPFCTFNFSYARKKSGRSIEVQYITTLLLNALK